MGLTGLLRFIKLCSKSSLTNVKLKRCRLLIDGKNFAYFLQESLPSHSLICGGDYHSFAKKLDHIFSAFHKCSIEVCIIMDGPIADTKKAVQKAAKLMESSSKYLWELNPENISTLKRPLLNPLLLDTFIKTAQKHGIVVLQAERIADVELVYISKRFNIPILSCDSDFYLQGIFVIQPESLNFSSIQRCEKTGEFHLEGVAFDPFHFSKVIGIRKELLPFIRMTDRQFTSHILKIHRFTELLISLNREDKIRYGQYSPFHTVKDWILQHSKYTREEIIDILLGFINEEFADEVPKYRASMRRAFDVVEASSKLLPWFISGPHSNPCGHCAFSSSCERDLSDWETNYSATLNVKSVHLNSSSEGECLLVKNNAVSTNEVPPVKEKAFPAEEHSLSGGAVVKEDAVTARGNTPLAEEDVSSEKDVSAKDVISAEEHSPSDLSTDLITTQKKNYVELPFFSLNDEDIKEYKEFKQSRKLFFTRKHFDLGELEDCSSCTHGQSELNFSGGLPVPRWLNLLQKQYFVNSETLDIFLKKHLITTPIVENTSKPSVYVTVMPVIKIIAAVGDSTYLEYQKSTIQSKFDEAKAAGDNVLMQQLLKSMEKEETLAGKYNWRISKLRKLNVSYEKSEEEKKLIDFRKSDDEVDEQKKLAKRLRKKFKLADDPERKDELLKQIDEISSTSIDNESNEQKYDVDEFCMNFLDSKEIQLKFVKKNKLDELYLIPAVKINCVSKLTQCKSKSHIRRSHKEKNKCNRNVEPKSVEPKVLNLQQNLQEIPTHVDGISNRMSSMTISENGVPKPSNTFAHIDDEDNDADVILEDGSDVENTNVQLHINGNKISDAIKCDENYRPVGKVNAIPVDDQIFDEDTAEVPELSKYNNVIGDTEKDSKNLKNVPGDDIKYIKQLDDSPGETVADIEQLDNLPSETSEIIRQNKLPCDPVVNIQQLDNEPEKHLENVGQDIIPGEPAVNIEHMSSKLEIDTTNNGVHSMEFEFQIVFNNEMIPGLRIITELDKLKKKQAKILHDEFETALNVLRNDCINLRILAKSDETKESLGKLVQELGKKITERMVSKFKLLDITQKTKLQLKNEWENLSNYEGLSKYDWMDEDDSSEQSLVPYQNRLYMVKMRKSVGITFNTYKFENEIQLSKITPLQKVISKSIDDRKVLFYSYLNTSGDKYSCLPDEVEFVIFVICYWYDNSKVQVNRCHLYTILISFIRYYFVDKGIGGISSEEDIQILLYRHTSFLKEKKKKLYYECIASILKKPNVKHCAQAALNLLPYEEWNPKSYKFCKKQSFLHALSEFQMCYLFLCGLNNCVGNPFHTLSIDKILNCVLSCNIFMQLVKARDENIEMVKLLDDCNHVKKLLDKLNKFCGDVLDIPVVMDIFPEKIVEVTDEGVEKITFMSKESTKENWKKEVARLKEKRELEEIDALAKELGDVEVKNENSKPKKKTKVRRGYS